MSTEIRLETTASDKAKSENGVVSLLAHSSPVFIIGSPCSNASSLATSLSASKDLWCSTESHLFYDLIGPNDEGKSKLYAAFENATSNESFWLSKNHVMYPEFASYMGLGIDQMFKSRSNGQRWIDASPENTLVSSDLAYMFPKASFLAIVRDGRDAVSTMLASGLDKDDEEGFFDACEIWKIYATRILEFQNQFPSRCFEIRYEQILHGLRKEIRKIMSFLEASDDLAVMAFLGDTKKEFSERLWSDWDANRKKTFETVAGSMMEEVGYILDWD